MFISYINMFIYFSVFQIEVNFPININILSVQVDSNSLKLTLTFCLLKVSRQYNFRKCLKLANKKVSVNLVATKEFFFSN